MRSRRCGGRQLRAACRQQHAAGGKDALHAQTLVWMTPLTTFTLSPALHGVESDSVMARLEPSSMRTVIS